MKSARSKQSKTKILPGKTEKILMMASFNAVY